MIVRHLNDAKPYEAPNHRKYESLRIYGAEMGGSQTLMFGISHFQPGGGAGPDASPPEKIYHILKGELTSAVKSRSPGPATLSTSRRMKIARLSTAAWTCARYWSRWRHRRNNSACRPREGGTQ
jgi:hypothetical protein